MHFEALLMKAILILFLVSSKVIISCPSKARFMPKWGGISNGGSRSSRVEHELRGEFLNIARIFIRRFEEALELMIAINSLEGTFVGYLDMC